MVTKKRNKNAIILGFSSAIIIFIVFSLFSYFYIYKNIVKIGEDKANFSMLLKNYNDLKNRGLPYGDYRKLVSSKSFDNAKLTELLSDDYTRELLIKVDKDFYDENFINLGTQKYEEFLKTKDKENKDNNILENFRQKEEQIASVLPVYVSETDFTIEYGLTDFKFVNYIENLLRDYKLKTTSPIGIDRLESIDKNSSKDEENIDETGIYYIPLKLELVGTKSNIINFLRDIYSMGSVVEKDGDIEVQDNNHIVETYYIEMKDYIDSSAVNNEKNLIDLVTESEQSNQRFSISTELRFFIVGVPQYKLKEEIEKVIGTGQDFEYNYYSLVNRVETSMKDITGLGNSQKVEEINKYLGTIKSDILDISKKLNSSQNLEPDFMETMKYKEIFILINKELNNMSNQTNLN